MAPVFLIFNLLIAHHCHHAGITPRSEREGKRASEKTRGGEAFPTRVPRKCQDAAGKDSTSSLVNFGAPYAIDQILLRTCTGVEASCRANAAHISQSRPDYGLDLSHFQPESIFEHQIVPASLGFGRGSPGTDKIRGRRTYFGFSVAVEVRSAEVRRPHGGPCGGSETSREEEMVCGREKERC